MMEWDCRMKNDHGVKILKAAIPFLDVCNGEPVDLEGLLQAVEPLVPRDQKKIVDMLLQLFQMRRMMDLVQVMQMMQQMTPDMGSQEQTDEMHDSTDELHDLSDETQDPADETQDPADETQDPEQGPAGSSPDWFSVLQTLFAAQPSFGGVAAADSDNRNEGKNEPVNF